MSKKKKKRKPAIKIKINGDERPFSEEAAIHDWQSGSNEAAATASEESMDEEEFDWILPEVEKKEMPEFHKVNYAPTERKLPSHWRKKMKPGISGLILSILLAVAIGLVLGSFILKMAKLPEDSSTIAVNEVKLPPAAEEKVKDVPKTGYVGKLPAIGIPVLQGGVFSTQEAAEERAREFSAHELASKIVILDGQYYVFIGVAGDLPTAKEWESELKQKGIDVWAKELTIQEKEIKLTSKAEADELTAETEVYHLLAKEAAGGQLLGKLNDDTLTEVAKVMGADKSTSYKNELANDLHSKLAAAQKSLIEFQKSSTNKQELLKAQQALLEYMSIYLGVSD
ncbi:SPOR domain-containing protein [Lederbergia citrea]|uniref:SPOR domain-containing protein n=1 Tax=Lederbergia citrea TaxID=2833581 RepID=UPI001BCA38AF|nr:SPOR domain-containing protein [Lederbergia citrea]MBS4176192.1 SPOR domain-containing protein [Lederbergia citrea]MBS4202752.1 SPOR domain-containing protein [Lederbergia citrea]